MEVASSGVSDASSSWVSSEESGEEGAAFDSTETEELPRGPWLVPPLPALGRPSPHAPAGGFRLCTAAEFHNLQLAAKRVLAEPTKPKAKAAPESQTWLGEQLSLSAPLEEEPQKDTFSPSQVRRGVIGSWLRRHPILGAALGSPDRANVAPEAEYPAPETATVAGSAPSEAPCDEETSRGLGRDHEILQLLRQLLEGQREARQAAAPAQVKPEVKDQANQASDKAQAREHQLVTGSLVALGVKDLRILMLHCFLAWRAERKPKRTQEPPRLQDAIAQVSEDDRLALQHTDQQVPRVFAGAGSVPPVLPNHAIRALLGEEVFLEADGSLRGASLWLSMRPPKATRQFLKTFDLCLPWRQVEEEFRQPSSHCAAMRWVLLLLAFSSAAADEHIVLKPKGTGQQKMLVFIPGGKVPNHHYQLTGQAIQDAMSEQGINLWVVIPTVFQNLCIISCSTTFLCAPLHNTVKGAVSQAEAQGWISNSSETWLAGHSLGATCANTLFQAYSSAYSGLIVMGGYVDETGDHDLLHYPVPVLTLNVELDGGLARPGKISTWWRQFLTLRHGFLSAVCQGML
ncbi:unnamed protein product [Effrenium voratum]|uniref:Uncharacterized protein n=1 Tax=Effrenium voratum TaxID=2562239 RepID=A0AA36I7C9_9DINO|nr:unnamed protein product [Effrenium voratum]